jgi:hypothetical protein
LGCDAHLSVSTPHASFENIAHPQLLPDLTEISIRAGNIIRDARARDDLEIGEFGERGQNVLLHPLGEKRILLVGAEIGEREHGNAFFRKDNLGRLICGDRFRWILRLASPEKERGNAQHQQGCGHQED